MPEPIAGPDLEAAQVDVIVPIHGAVDSFARCADSLRRHAEPSGHRVVLVVDGVFPGCDRVEEIAATLRPVEVVLLHNPTRLGFVASVNRGMALSRRDVVLLNSDTVVTRGWVAKLRRAAWSGPEVATATPFSNNATLCSLPFPFVENTLPAGHDVDSLADLVEECSRREYPEIPTGAGFCLYVRRRALEGVGLFDEKRFGLGYGEETDFCMRAQGAGYRHVLDDATFIYHEGQRSFGSERRQRVAAAHRVMRRRHPTYWRKISRFMIDDPLAPARGRVLDRLRPARTAPSPAPRVLHVVHGWPPWDRGGTEQYAQWLARQQGQRGEVSAFARFADPDRHLGDAIEHLDHGVRVRLVVNNFTQRDPLSRNGLHDRRLESELDRFLAEIRPDLVHLHHLAGLTAGIVSRLVRRRVPFVYQVQDWWPICSRVNLFHRDGVLCSGPAPLKCSSCRPLTRLPGAAAWNPLLYLYRGRAFRGAIARAAALVMGSEFIAETYRRWRFLPPSVPVHVLPYGVDVGVAGRATTRPPGRGTGPLRFGYVGAVLPHKGVHVAVDAFRRVAPELATLEIWGNLAADAGYTELLRARASASTSFHGAFAEEEKSALYSTLDALLIPSLGLESFGIVGREAMASGVPVLASRRGALPEMFTGSSGGTVFEPGDDEGLANLVLRIVEQPRMLDEWRRSMPEIKRLDQHAAEIAEVYSQVLQGAR